MSGPGNYVKRRFVYPIQTESIYPHGEVLAGAHGVLGVLVNQGRDIDTTLKRGQHLLTVGDHHYIFRPLPQSDRGRIHAAYGLSVHRVFIETLDRVLDDLRKSGVPAVHRPYRQ